MDREMDQQADRQTDGGADKGTDTHRRTDRWTDAWTDGRVDRQTDRHVVVLLFRVICIRQTERPTGRQTITPGGGPRRIHRQITGRTGGHTQMEGWLDKQTDM